MLKDITSRSVGMWRFKQILLLGVMMMWLTACVGPTSIESNHLPAPKLDFFSYFTGKVHGSGLVRDWRGKITRQFTVTMEGSINSQQQLIIDEFFVFNDGQSQTRRWTVNALKNGELTGFANDTIGNAQGKMLGNAMNWHYKLAIPFKGKSITLKFDDWLYLQQDQQLLNVVTMRKFGLPVGSLVIAFHKSK
jgi:hypothetical protein